MRKPSATPRILGAISIGLVFLCAILWIILVNFRNKEVVFDQLVQPGMNRIQVYGHLRDLGNYEILELAEGSCSNLHEGNFKREDVFISPFIPRLTPGSAKLLCFDQSDVLVEISNLD